MRVMLKPVAFVVVSLIVLVALWIYFKPQLPEQQAQDGAKAAGVAAPGAMGVPAFAQGASAGEPAGARSAEVGTPSVRADVFDLTIKGGKLRSGPEVLQVHQGERVTLNIRSDSRDELHLHGYDLHAQLGPGETASLQFIADRTGRFGMELHKAHSELGALEVYPR
jgi:hypothetical protein